MKSLIEIATEMNDVMGIKPPIKTVAVKRTILLEKVTEAAGMIDPEQDEFSDETIEALKDLGLWPGEKEEEPEEEEVVLPKKGKGKAKPEPVKEEKKGKVKPKPEPEEEEDDEPEIAKDPKPKKAKKPGKEKNEEKGPGIISTIVECIEKAGKKGISKEEILKVLVKNFPKKAEVSMKNTVNVQVPARINKEKFEVGKTEDGKYFKK